MLQRPAALAALLTLAATLPFHAGWLVDPASITLANPFHGVHAWAADVVSDALWRLEWPDPTDQAGYPLPHRARYVAWAVMLTAALLRPVTSALVVVNASAWLGPALGAAAMVALARRLQPGASPLGLVLAGLFFGLSPVTHGAAVSGQVENSQSYVLPLLLWALCWAGGGARRWAALGLLGLLGGLTSPYLAMLAGFAAPWVALRVGLRRSVGPLAALGLGLWLASRWLDAGGFDPDADLFRPAWTPAGGAWPPLWGRPPAAAPLDTLLFGTTTPQARAMVVHQPYLGLVLVGAALIFGGRRRAWLFPALVGVALALGPVLGWGEGPLRWGDQIFFLPGALARTLRLPIAEGGQYYRAVVLAHLGFAGMLAGARLQVGWVRRGLPLAGLLGVLDTARALSLFGLPWPVFHLPVSAWHELAADPAPGGVLHLPMFSPQLIPCHPVRLVGRVFHGRPISDMPRSWREPTDMPALLDLHACTKLGAGCSPPSTAALAALGFRYVVIDLDDVPERKTLLRRLTARWGPPEEEVDHLVWWRIGAETAGPLPRRR